MKAQGLLVVGKHYTAVNWAGTVTLNPMDQINRKPDDRKNDQPIEKAKNHNTEQYCFEPNIWSNLHLVHFDVFIEKVKKFDFGFYAT